MKKESWKQEIARDTLALGSIAFFILVIGRALIAPYMEFTYQLIISFIALTILTLFIKNSEKHIARAIILVTFTILFYNIMKFTIFAIIILIALFVSVHYLKIEKISILKGTILGIISSLIGYYSISLL